MIVVVEINFDPAKDAANIRKHGMSLAFGAVVLASAIGEVEDHPPPLRRNTHEGIRGDRRTLVWLRLHHARCGAARHRHTQDATQGGHKMAEQKPTRMKITPEKLEEIKRSVDWARIDAMTDDEIERNIASDPDAATFSDAELTAIRVQQVRKSTGLSQPEFARRFQLPVATLRDWEQARREPDAAAVAYLRVIERDPQAVLQALEPNAA
jgi:putative transcriptional regulator